MADPEAYEKSTLDWGALRSLAKRATEETPLDPDPRIVYVDRSTNTNVEVLGQHWVLDYRFENANDERNPHCIEEDHTDDIYALLPDGQMMFVRVVDEARIFGSGSRPSFKDHHEARQMTDSDVEVFDFAQKYDEFGPPDSRVWGTLGGNGSRRGDLLHDAKGAGLTALLEAIRSGEAKPPAIPTRFHTVKEPGPPAASAGRSRRPIPSVYRAGLLRRPALLAGAVAVVVAAVLFFTFRDKPAPDAHIGTNAPIITARQIVEHPTISVDAADNAMRAMAIGACWNGTLAYSNADKQYMLVEVPMVVDCSSREATQQLFAISNDGLCHGTEPQMNLTQGTLIDGKTYCQLLQPSEGMCLPFSLDGSRGNFFSRPVVCDTPPSPRYPQLMHLVSRLASDNGSCDTNDGLYYIWFPAVNTGFCYQILR
jgi:hypothetical protein